MPDICMCSGQRAVSIGVLTCPLRNDCYRYTATPTKGRQSYFAVAPFLTCGICEQFYPTTARTSLINDLEKERP